MARPWLSPVSHDLVWFSGPDAIAFLNDLISQDIAAMAQAEVGRSLLLGPRGKLDHLLWVLRGDNLVGLATDQGRGDELEATLRRYRIRVKVDIESEARPLWVVMGAEAVGWSGDRTTSLDADVSWQGAPRMLVAGEQPAYEKGTVDKFEAARVAAGEPMWGVDIDEKTIPQETGMTRHTVAFEKGCYLGQELVARIHSRGHVNRHLRHLRLSAPVGAGSPIMADGKEVGLMTTVAGLLGMGMVRRELNQGDRVVVGDVEAEVAEIVRD